MRSLRLRVSLGKAHTLHVDDPSMLASISPSGRSRGFSPAITAVSDLRLRNV
jgi:hypothetical protein